MLLHPQPLPWAPCPCYPELRDQPGLGMGREPLQQPQDKVSVTAGETLTLNCTTSGDGPIGPVKWLKGWGSENETIYDQTGTIPRVTRAVTESDTDFTIHIRDVRPKDAGTYYCVKFGKSLRGISVFQRGNGTEVSVYGEWGSQSRRSSLRNLVQGPKISLLGGWGCWQVQTCCPQCFRCHPAVRLQGLGQYQHLQAHNDLFRSCFR
uniref:Ig-like domain-containing protein n=1 Tax=Strigops habroptila TaxID=2489341 RepID=A0A672UJE3_STRHB